MSVSVSSPLARRAMASRRWCGVSLRGRPNIAAALAPVGLIPIKPHRIVDQKSFLQIGGRSDLRHIIDKRNVVAKASTALAGRQSQKCSDVGYLVVIEVEADIRSDRSKSV
jgi:hypothetical protein